MPHVEEKEPETPNKVNLFEIDGSIAFDEDLPMLKNPHRLSIDPQYDSSGRATACASPDMH